MQSSIDLQGWAELDAQWRQAPEVVAEELTRTTLEAELLLQREVQELTPVGVGGAGGLKGSILAQLPQALPDGVIGVVGTSAAHAVPVELGTKPHFPPVAPLEDWVKAKLGVEPKDARRVAFLIARKIAARGTKGAFMFRTALEQHQAPVAGMYQAARARIAARLAGDA